MPDDRTTEDIAAKLMEITSRFRRCNHRWSAWRLTTSAEPGGKAHEWARRCPRCKTTVRRFQEEMPKA